MRSRITVVPHGGLCNRLRTLVSAYYAADTYRLSIAVEWGSDRECWAHFEDLFLPISHELFSIKHRSFWNNYISRKNLRLPGLLRYFLYGKQQSQYDPRRHGSLLSFIDHKKHVYLSTGYVLTDYPAETIHILSLQPHLQQRVDEVKCHFSQHMVGVHIRRTDHAVAIANSSVESFCQAMDAEIEHCPDVQFYLATDDDQLKASLCEKYGQRIVVQPAHCRRDTLEGIEDAVVDLWLLASTQKILGSFYSSFSDMAAEIGGIPLVVMKSK